jgi:hypothetical protein
MESSYEQAIESGAEPSPAPQEPTPAYLAEETSQEERSVMRPDGDDPEWRYYFGAWHS